MKTLSKGIIALFIGSTLLTSGSASAVEGTGIMGNNRFTVTAHTQGESTTKDKSSKYTSQGGDFSYQYRSRDMVNVMTSLSINSGKAKEVQANKTVSVNFSLAAGYNIGLNSDYSITPFVGISRIAKGFDYQTSEKVDLGFFSQNIDYTTRNIYTVNTIDFGIKNEFDATNKFKLGLDLGGRFITGAELNTKTDLVYSNETTKTIDAKATPQLFMATPISYSFNKVIALTGAFEYSRLALESKSSTDKLMKADLSETKVKVGAVISF